MICIITVVFIIIFCLKCKLIKTPACCKCTVIQLCCSGASVHLWFSMWEKMCPQLLTFSHFHLLQLFQQPKKKIIKKSNALVKGNCRRTPYRSLVHQRDKMQLQICYEDRLSCLISIRVIEFGNWSSATIIQADFE